MTTGIVALTRRQEGLLSPTRSTARSEAAGRLASWLQDPKRHLRSSISLTASTEAALDELDAVALEAAADGWNGYRGLALKPASHRYAQAFLRALPTSLPRPEIAVSGDGEVAFDWMF